MKKLIKRCLMLTAVAALGACSMMEEDRDHCPTGLYVTFKYDYNLQRADMFSDHVGEVTLYVYDAEGRLVTTQTESNGLYNRPLATPGYTMHLDLQPGSYRLVALAQQRPYTESLADGSRARFVRTEQTAGSDITTLAATLDARQQGDAFIVDNHGQPLDTLWHGMSQEPVVIEYSDVPAYDTISLVRDTKKINITLRELDDPTTIDIADYDLTIADRNRTILWNNAVKEDAMTIYTPHATWNSEDKVKGERFFASKANHRFERKVKGGTRSEGVGRMAHADFMTSRIIYHDSAADDARLRIVHKETDELIVDVNLADMLSRLRRYEDIHRYTPQEFLDRGYDYQLDFFLKGGELKYAYISISVLSWAMRVQFEELE